jgi:hypothetical protein
MQLLEISYVFAVLKAKKNKAMMKNILQVDVKIGSFTRFGFTPKILTFEDVTCFLGSFSDELVNEPMFESYLPAHE